MKKRPWQVEISQDKVPTKVVKKSRAMGLTEMTKSDFSKVLRKKGK